MGVLDASTSPPKERYAVSKDNIIKLIQPGNVDISLGTRAGSARGSATREAITRCGEPMQLQLWGRIFGQNRTEERAIARPSVRLTDCAMMKECH